MAAVEGETVKVLRVRHFELNSTAGLVFEEVASECFQVVASIRKYHFILRDASGVTSETIYRLRDQLTDIFVKAGFLYWEEVPAETVNLTDDLPF